MKNHITTSETCWFLPSSKPRPRRWLVFSWPTWSPQNPSQDLPCYCTNHRISVSRIPSLFLKLYCLYITFTFCIIIIITAIIAIQFRLISRFSFYSTYCKMIQYVAFDLSQILKQKVYVLKIPGSASKLAASKNCRSRLKTILSGSC